MKRVNHKSILIAILFAVSIISCSDNSSTTKTSQDTTTGSDTVAQDPSSMSGSGDTSGGTMNASASGDGMFLMKGAETDMTEIKSSEAAQSKSTNKDVKSLAAMMIDEHTKMSKLTADLASKKNVTLPTDLPAEKKAMLDKAAGLSGNDFDKEYVSQLIAGHNEAISMLQRASAEATDPDIKSWAAAALPKVQMHLKMVQETESKLKK